ncbi:PREDICTED: deformed epidermal autoregulatory factor 1 homolog isoform X2 [Branchiostoma belcheri]|uniref:Deformed epidermal autoregulatory factor 1 homolog isoform X1 n=1 Tax=Branchiostoma belcheri TaxID=7741 RepID=A0A6P4ZVJ9_BRABE|nr:PREDICTED: deformed epidermal autoregulatory factor 1 homolog isoform X1 [Branchiostoma belcheri]XP_019638035.1 PREDICTED: deformed epidermal autoregulatory factor 1 homolog isoform X2 [Branchiostoma belcheri]
MEENKEGSGSGSDAAEVSVLAEQGPIGLAEAEELPSGDDSAFSEAGDPHPVAVSTVIPTTCTPVTVTSVSEQAISQVFHGTTPTLLTTEALHDGQKTTFIVVQDSSLDSGLKTPATPLTPATPATPSDGRPSSFFRYTWDDTINLPVLPVRCRNTSGELYKSKLGSGGRGKCIKVGDVWYTPSEFEALSGRASSKDWKRSIRYGGRTLHTLIEEGVLTPHATSCTCAACCDDESVVSDSGPVRLFVPYKRRKRDSTSEPLTPTKKVPRGSLSKPPTLQPSNLAKDGTVTITTTPTGTVITQRGSVSLDVGGSGDTVNTPTFESPVKWGTANFETSPSSGENHTLVITPIPPPTPKSATPTLTSVDVMEQKQWWHLEEMVGSIIQQAQQLKNMIEQAKQQCQAAKESALAQARIQAETEKKEVLSQARVEAQIQLERALMESRAEKDSAVAQAIAQARADKLEAVAEAKQGHLIKEFGTLQNETITVRVVDENSINESEETSGEQGTEADKD